MSQRWLALTKPTVDSASQPLGINAQLTSEGQDGPFATGLRAIILTYAGPATLSQVSAFVLSPFISPGSAVQSWLFAGIRNLDVPDQPIVIPTTNSTQQFLIGASVGVRLNGSSASFSYLNVLQVPDASPAAVTQGLQLSLGIDNPATPANTDTVDCASCHLANRMRARAESLGASSAGLDAFSAPPYNLTNNVEPAIGTSLAEMRAFGYGTTGGVALNQRVINESARVAAYLSDKLLGASAK